MVNARLCETARLTSKNFSLQARDILTVLDCETESSKFFERERETFTQTLRIRGPDLDESYENELE